MNPHHFPKLDWRSRHDERSRNYRAVKRLEITSRTRVLWRPGLVNLDQGQEGACVGFGWANEAFASPVRVKPPTDPNAFARVIYRAAQKIDEWPGEDYEGSSVLAGAKVMQARGFLNRYEWCFSVAEVIAVLLHRGPVVLGVPWFESMYVPDITNRIRVYGAEVGGHCILANGYHPVWPNKSPSAGAGVPMIHLQNSWGLDWGVSGGAWISPDDLAILLADDGEACVPASRSYGPKPTATVEGDVRYV